MKQLFTKNFWTDRDISLLVGQILRIGVLIASTILIIGAILYLIVHGQEPVPNYRLFASEPSSNTTIPGIIKGVLTGSVPQIIQLGVLVLICTPILRVVGSLLGFVIEKDRLYIGITSMVLFVIIFSILSGVKG